MLVILNLIRLILYLRHVDWQVVVDWRFEVCSSVMLTNSLQKFQKSVSVIWLHINKLAVICIFGWQLSANAPQTVDNKWSTSMCYTANKCNSYLNTLNVGGSYLHFWLTVLHHRQLTTNDQLICVTQPLWEESYFSLPNLIYKPPNIIGQFYLIAAVAARGEGDRPESEQKASPLPVRASQERSKNRKMSLRGKKVNSGSESRKEWWNCKNNIKYLW